MENTDILNAMCASVLTTRTGLQISQILETKGNSWNKEVMSLVGENYVREYLSKLDIHRSVVPNGMYLLVLREPADVVAVPLSIIFD